MDLNALLFHHQVALISATQQTDDCEASDGIELARDYAHRIARLRREMGVSQYPDWL